jgi:FAD/FMN-containing dehydrogenase
MHVRTQVPGIEGTVVRRGDADYDAVWAGELWNGLRPRRHPDVIVRAASAADVPAAVAMARSEGLRIAVRSGGHSWCGSPLRDGGMLLDLSALRRCAVDTEAATAVVEPGVIGSELARELTARDLAFPTGHCASVAVGGYLLSGGLGWNSGRWGPACASVRAIDAVTADGSVVRCSDSENADLLWAARGAGPGFFAVVTAFHLSLHPRPVALARTSYAYPMAAVEPLATWVTGTARGLPACVEVAFTLGTDGASGQPAVTLAATAFAATHEEAENALEPLRDPPLAGPPLSRTIAEPTALDALYEGAAAAWPKHLRYAADTLWSDAPYAELLSRLGAAVARAPSAKSLVLAPLAPASRDAELLRDMAFPVLGESYAVPYAVWDDPAGDGANIRWLREAMAAVEPLGTGHYIAETDLGAAPDRARRSYTPDGWERLAALRAAYDPGGLFHSYLTP